MKNLINRALVAEKKLFILFAAVLMAVGVSAQRKNATAEDWSYFQQKGCTLKLEYYGLYKDGVEQNKIYPQGKNQGEYCVLKGNTIFHKNTLDGDFFYDFRIDGQYLYLSNKVVLKKEGGIKGFDPDYDNWLRLVWVERQGGKITLFTYDKYNTYRYFTTDNPGLELPNGLVLYNIHLGDSYDQVIASLKSQGIEYKEASNGSRIKCFSSFFPFMLSRFNNLYIYFDTSKTVRGIMLGFVDRVEKQDGFLDTYEESYARLKNLLKQMYPKYYDPEITKELSKDYSEDASISAYSDRKNNVVLYIVKEQDHYDDSIRGYTEVIIQRMEGVEE